MTSSKQHWGCYLSGILTGAGVATYVLPVVFREIFPTTTHLEELDIAQARAFLESMVGLGLLLAGIFLFAKLSRTRKESNQSGWDLGTPPQDILNNKIT